MKKILLAASMLSLLLIDSGYIKAQKKSSDNTPAKAQKPVHEKTLSGKQKQDYKGDVKIPDALLKVYSDFVKAAKQPHSDFQNIMLPNSVSITYEERPVKTREYGQDLNLPFLQKQFQPKVRVVRKDRADCYLLRTDSSALWFVETKSQGWRLYRYLDKPIE